jgi:hypothetical protein
MRLLDGLSPDLQRTSTAMQVRNEVATEVAARR